ncbi:ribonuclease J [Turicibacter sp. H121]|uniref:Ribonuclease J n=1 Tax=Turicibacter bilis TaxID=2735723 RepID=A0A9Q9FJE0_9FIRM|nr:MULTISPECIES: ribonuclease J [Turicibacter]MBP3909017.1 ribonuclease J [Turicibacter sp.]CUN75855.1 Ribonuclease J 1 [Turicibacter sanguinis]AMC08668.1 ribonuclease J [Turicibacter sp. H121]MBS3197217.1 ribonuclease J [Turicibacter bilis]MCU7194598.1 ribonuclease J [Turicibacter sp. T129]
MEETQKLKVIPLGGLGEIGKNMTAIEYDDELIVIDCGIAFPDEDMYGVDLIIPDISYLIENESKLKGIFITHGHEDHIGAIPFILKQVNIPIYGTRLTIGLIENKLKEHGLLATTSLNIIKPRESAKFNHLEVEFIRNTHSIADSCSLAIHTPVGIIFHTGDFKVDLTPIDNEPMDFERISELAKEGILLLMSDSTNVERKGYTMSERAISETFTKLFEHATGRIIVATFASNIHRMQQIIDASKRYNRKVAFSGRSMENISKVATELGYLHIDDDQLVNIHNINSVADDELTLIVTGSQGEPMGALARIAFSNHRHIKLKPNDLFIISASPIPGNDKLIGRVINELYRKGCNVIYKDLEAVHVSGHACQEELKLILRLTHPKFFMPVHGEYRHLVHHKNLAEKVGIPKDNIVVLSTGQVLELTPHSAEVNGRVRTGAIFVDGIGVGDVGNVVLRDRRMLAEGGMLIVVATIDKESKTLVSEPYIVTRGFVYVKESEDLMNEVKQITQTEIEMLLENETNEILVMKNRIKKALERYLYEKTKRRPSIFPIIMEV